MSFFSLGHINRVFFNYVCTGASVEEMEVSSVSKRRSLCSLAQAESKKSKRVEDTGDGL